MKLKFYVDDWEYREKEMIEEIQMLKEALVTSKNQQRVGDYLYISPTVSDWKQKMDREKRYFNQNDNWRKRSNGKTIMKCDNSKKKFGVRHSKSTMRNFHKSNSIQLSQGANRGEFKSSFQEYSTCRRPTVGRK